MNVLDCYTSLSDMINLVLSSTFGKFNTQNQMSVTICKVNCQPQLSRHRKRMGRLTAINLLTRLSSI